MIVLCEENFAGSSLIDTLPPFHSSRFFRPCPVKDVVYGSAGPSSMKWLCSCNLMEEQGRAKTIFTLFKVSII